MHCRLSPAFLLASLAVGQVFVAPAARGDEGVASYTLYELRQTLKTIDFGENRQQSLAEFTGVVRSEQAGSMFDSMTEYCIGTFFNDGKQRSGNGGCKLVDADGDQVFQTFNTSSSATPPGSIGLVGGTGKYKGLEGRGTYTLQVFNGPQDGQAMLVLTKKVNWKRP
jgi:hypothetical protein